MSEKAKLHIDLWYSGGNAVCYKMQVCDGRTFINPCLEAPVTGRPSYRAEFRDWEDLNMYVIETRGHSMLAEVL